MYLRLLALLLLCVSSGMSATLRHSRQTVEEAEEEAPALVTEEPPALVTEEPPALVTEEPPLAPEEESPVAEALVADSHAAVVEEEPSSPEAAAQETLALAAEEPSVEDSPVEEPLAGDSPAVDIPPVEEAPVVEEAPPVVAEAEDSHVAVDDAAPADVDTDTAVETPVDPPQQGANPEDAEPAEEAQAQAEDSDTLAVAAEEAQEEPATGSQAEDTPAGEAAVLTDAPAAAAEEEEEDTPAAEEEDTPAAVEDTPLAADADAAVDGDSDTEVVAADADAAVADGDGAGADADTGLGGDLWENLIPEEDGVEDIMAPLPEADDADDGGWGIGSIRSSFQAVNGYFDSLVEMVGGRNGVCQYRCRYGKTPYPRPGFVLPEPNGCSSALLGFEQFDLGIPAMTKCCNQLDECYDTCGSSKNRCDSKFRWCLHGICSELKKSLGFVSKVEVCESMADAMYNTVWTLGCRSYMNSQRAACFCEGEERDEL